jgi:DNA primase
VVARRVGLQVPERRYEAGPEKKEREELQALLDAAAEHFQKNLWSGPGTRAREYLLGRGFKKETLERIRAGAAVDSWSDLLDTLRRRFPLPPMMTAGLVLEGQQAKRPYDRFRNRAVFPILSDSGRVVGFGARSLDGSEPKYLNSPESPLYQKSRTLYGLSWAKEAIRNEGRVVLMEGYLDVARALEAGVNEAVATCGTALTSAHARLLRRFAERVVVNFDQDEAGQKAARKSLDLLIEEGLKVQVVELPQGEDPDTYLKGQGAEAYRARLAEAPSAVEWLVKTAAAENDTRTPEGKAAYLAAILPTLARIDSAVERTAWVPRIIERGGLDPLAAREELRRALAKGLSSMPAAVHVPREGVGEGLSDRPRRLLPVEKLLLALIVEGKEGLTPALAELAEDDLVGLRSAAILKAAREAAAAGRAVTLAGLGDVLDEEDARLVHQIAIEAGPLAGVEPADCVRELLAIRLRARMAEIQKDLPRATGTAEQALLEEKLQIKRKIASL